jgi:hypothetical protein
MAQRIGSGVGCGERPTKEDIMSTPTLTKYLLVAVVFAAARPSWAQATPDPVVAPVVQTRLDSVVPEDSNGESSPKSPEQQQITYQDNGTGSGRVLHYRLESEHPLEADDEQSHELHITAAARATNDGLLLPYTLSPRIKSGQSWVRAVAGYDSASASFRARSAAESSVTNFLAIRVEYERGPAKGFEDRVGLGGRIQLLSQSKHGIDGGFGVFYQPKDFRGEGNVVGGLMLGRRFGRFGLFGSALFGSDPEGDDQDLDGRLSMLYRASDRVQVGWDNRIRYVLASTDAKRFGTVNTDWELALEPTATVSLGPLAILTEAGFSALQNRGPIGQLNDRRVVRTGVIAMAGASGVF